MNYYSLKLKISSEVVDRIQSESLEEAKLFYMGRKQMSEKSFNKIYEVKKDIQKKIIRR